ncbi:MAG: C-GCAxxG-C-C family protein [Rikenellaceae bacterium]
MEKTRPQIAVDFFREGYNCAQSVVLAYKAECGMTEEMAKNISAPFGAGVGRQREVCGAVSGMCMIIGASSKFDDADKAVARKNIYEQTQKMCSKFKEHHGSIVCREILGDRAEKALNPVPSPRTESYYATRPCEKCIEDAAIILDEMFAKHIITV